MKYFSMFSGIGGFEYGIQQSDKNLKCVGCSEIDVYAKSIYEKHFPSHYNYGDVREIVTDDLPKFELLTGGFPCQSFSVAGNRKGFDDTRGTLFFEVARILNDCKPKYFILENVKNLISHDKGNTFKVILKTLSDLGYDVEWEVYNSKNHGVLQNRERVFMKGYLRDETNCKILMQKRFGKESTNDLMKINNHRSQGQRIYDLDGLSVTISSTGGGLGSKCGLYLIPDDFEKIDDDLYMTTTRNGDTYALNTRFRSRPLSRKQDNYIIDGCRVRKLTPLECERLQGFPDNWTQFGKDGEPISDTQRYKCIGNAVTTNVVTHIINNFEAIK